MAEMRIPKLSSKRTMCPKGALLINPFTGCLVVSSRTGMLRHEGRILIILISMAPLVVLSAIFECSHSYGGWLSAEQKQPLKRCSRDSLPKPRNSLQYDQSRSLSPMPPLNVHVGCKVAPKKERLFLDARPIFSLGHRPL